jgi:hypothetical protein
MSEPTVPCCGERAFHGHPEFGDPGLAYFNGRPYRYRHAFEWRRPALRRVTGADRITGVRLNRYPGVVIGVAAYLRGHGLSLLWGRPGRTIQAN